MDPVITRNYEKCRTTCGTGSSLQGGGDNDSRITREDKVTY